MHRRHFLVAVVSASLLQACATGPSRTSFISDRITVQAQGSGPDVVLIPGLATSRAVWAGTVAAVPGYRYHLVEVLGFNGTDPRGNRSPEPLVPAIAEDVARYIDEQRMVRPAIVGHSLGGLMTLIIAARHPRLVGRAMVVDMLPFNGMNFGGPAATVESVRSMAPAARERFFGADQAKRRQATEQLYRAFIQNEALRPAFIRQALTSDREVSGRLFAETFSFDLRTKIQAVQGPLTVVYTRAPNQPAARDLTDEMYRLGYQGVPHAVLKRINDTGHFIMLDQPENFHAEVRAFLSR